MSKSNKPLLSRRTGEKLVDFALVLPALIVYHTKKSRGTAVAGLVLGTVVLTAFGSAFNALYLLPKFAEMFMPMEAIIAAGSAIHNGINSVWTLVLICVVPLNLIKGISVSVLTMLLYKRVARPLFGLKR